MKKNIRGKYLKYLTDTDVTVPRSTILSRIKKNLRKTQNSSVQNIPDTSNIKEQIDNKINETIIDSDFQQFDFDLNNKIQQEEFVLQTNHQFNLTGDTNMEESHFIKLNLTESNTKEEYCSAALAFFFSGRMSQDHFSSAIKFFNLGSAVKLPTRFDLIRNSIKSNREEIIPTKKIYYCKTCNIEIHLKTRYQRICDNCKSR